MALKIHLYIALLMLCAPAWALDHASEGQVVTGRLAMYSEYHPEPGLLDVGYVEVFVQEEATHKIVAFRAEDSNGAMYSNYFNVRLVRHVYEKPAMLRLKSLAFGTRIEIKQTVSQGYVFPPRFSYRVL